LAPDTMVFCYIRIL